MKQKYHGKTEQMVKKQKERGHPWRRVYALSIKGISPDFKQKAAK